ncbi:MAG: ZPR1 zinc finger domain-containing protein [Candidatus Poseidoniaceae archaeon]
MEEQVIEMPCPMCHDEDNLRMIAHVDEIPYFGEHTQVTVLCHSCGWRQTDFIPAEGRKPGGWTFDIKSEDDLSVRVVRSSSCTVCIPELDLEVNPGSAATGFVTNMEGLMVRFIDIVKMVMNDIGDDEPENQQLLLHMLHRLRTAGRQGDALRIELLDPHGLSQILHDRAIDRDLTQEEMDSLPVGPDPAVFSA